MAVKASPARSAKLATMNKPVITLDVRDDLRQGREPFQRIMATVESLGTGGRLRLIAPFKPVPLIYALAQRGFSYAAMPSGAGDWEVCFERAGSSDAIQAALRPPVCPVREQRVLDVDARGLEPPQPMVVILEKLAHLPPGFTLRAYTDRRPMHLYDQLEERGFIGETESQEDGSYVTHIRPA